MPIPLPLLLRQIEDGVVRGGYFDAPPSRSGLRDAGRAGIVLVLALAAGDA
jgi:hypothetical protein